MEKSFEEKLKRLIEIIAQTSFNKAPEPKFPLASGQLSRFYVDCKKAFSYPEVRDLIGQLIVEKLPNLDFDSVGGLILGAYPVALAVSDAAYRTKGKQIKAFVVRKEPKGHGLQKHFEGDVRPGERVLIVDDVITSGGSTLIAIEKSRAFGLNVVGVFAIVDRQESNGRQNIEAEGVSFTALIDLEDLDRAT